VTRWLTDKDANGRSRGVGEVTASVSFSSTIGDDKVDSSSRTYPRMGMDPTPLRAVPGPTALRVCHESRTLALRKYTLSFGGVRMEDDGTDWESGVRGDKRTWINFEIDMILLRASTGYLSLLILMSKYAKEETKRIQHLAVGRHSLPWMWDGRRPTMEILAKFEALRDVSLVLPQVRVWNTTATSLASSVEGIQHAVEKTFEASAEWCPAWKTRIPKVELVYSA